MNNVISLELAKPDEISHLCEIAKEIWNEHYVPIIGQAQVDYMLEHFQSENAVMKQINDGYLYYIIRYEGETAGYCSVQVQGNKLFLSKLYIRKLFRGKKIAKFAFNYICYLAKKKNCSFIELTVNKYNDNTINIYKKLGFVVVDSIVNDIGSGFAMDDYIMHFAIQ